MSKRKVQSGDSLEDDLEYTVDSDAAADLASIEGDSDAALDSSGADSEADEAPSSSAAQEDPAPKKVRSAEERRARRKERRAVTKKRKLAELGVDEEDGEGSSIATATAAAGLHVDQQADLFAALIRDHASKSLSSIELGDLYLPASAFLDTTSFDSSSSSVRNLANLLSFLRRFTERETLEIATKENGRPHTLFLCPSAIRVADVTRALKPLKTKTGEPAKLFGKEKVALQAAFLAKTRINVAVGVPGRVLATILNGALKVDRVEQIYLDSSYLDSKKRGILKIKEVVSDLLKIIQHESISTRIKENGCKIVLF